MKTMTLAPNRGVGEQRMTSLDIANVTGKQHKDVLKAIRNMELAWEKINGRKFALVEYADAKGQQRPMYELTKAETLYIATKFNDEARARLVLRWQDLETEHRKQICTRGLLLEDKDVMHEAERIVTDTLERNNRNADGCLTASDIAKAIGIETRDLNSLLCDLGIQKWQRGQFRLLPQYEGLGLTQNRLFFYYSKDGKQKERSYLVWTIKGADFIKSKIIN